MCTIILGVALAKTRFPLHSSSIVSKLNGESKLLYDRDLVLFTVASLALSLGPVLSA